MLHGGEGARALDPSARSFPRIVGREPGDDRDPLGVGRSAWTWRTAAASGSRSSRSLAIRWRAKAPTRRRPDGSGTERLTRVDGQRLCQHDPGRHAGDGHRHQRAEGLEGDEPQGSALSRGAERRRRECVGRDRRRSGERAVDAFPVARALERLVPGAFTSDSRAHVSVWTKDA